MELTINKIVKVQEVDGKFGPQQRVAFKTNEYGDKILSGYFKFAPNEGQTLTGEVEEVEKDGKTYLNFKHAKKGAVNDSALKEINAKLDKIIDWIDKQPF